MYSKTSAKLPSGVFGGKFNGKWQFVFLIIFSWILESSARICKYKWQCYEIENCVKDEGETEGKCVYDTSRVENKELGLIIVLAVGVPFIIIVGITAICVYVSCCPCYRHKDAELLINQD